MTNSSNVRFAGQFHLQEENSLFFKWQCCNWVTLVINPKLQHPSYLPFDTSSGEQLQPLEKQREFPNINDSNNE